MNKRNQILTILLVLALVASLAGPAIASNLTKEAALTYRDIRITLDGQDLQPMDVNGNAVEPFIIDGTTYLPVRAIASALGLGVRWDEETSTVILESSQSAEVPEQITLDELWNEDRREFSLPGLPMDSDVNAVTAYFHMDHAPMYLGRNTVEPEMLTTLYLPEEELSVTAIMDTQWREGSLIMASLNCDLAENASLNDASKLILAHLTALYGEPATSTEVERDGVTTTQESVWCMQSSDNQDTRLTVWIASKDGAVTIIQISCDKPETSPST